MEIILTMKEQEKLAIIIRYADGVISGNEAATLLGLSIRQVQRKKKAYQEKGMASIVHGSKNRSSGRGFNDEFRQKILKLYKEEYYGWNFCHFRDALEDDYGINISSSFIYKLMIKNGIKTPARKKHKPKSHPPRPRKENAGDLVQIDASKHQWLYGNKKYYYLHGAIDDATGIVTACIMMKEETILGYQLIMQDTIKRYGIPECLYTDYRTVFQSNMANKEMSLEDYLVGKKIKDTRFAAMWKQLGSDIISTENPRAKGRIERLWRTFQDRLEKELRKNKISTMEEANRYINKVFLPKYNARFASQINSNKNHFVKVPENYDFNRKLATWVMRHVQKGCYVSVGGKYYVAKKDGQNARIITPEELKVFLHLDGTLHLEYEDRLYDLEEVPKGVAKQKPAVAPKKSLTKEEYSAIRRKCSLNSPWRNFSFGSALYKVDNKPLNEKVATHQ